MHSEGRGRPRLEQSRRPGKTAREEILDAAAELFTTHGYANTSTRRIADAVGVRQASLYHHFATKDDILDALLAGTVDEPLRLAAELLAEKGPGRAAPARAGGQPTSPSCAAAPGTSARSICCPNCAWTASSSSALRPRRTARPLPQAGRRGHRRMRRPRRRRRTAVPARRVGDQPPLRRRRPARRSSRGSSPTARCARSASTATSPRCGRRPPTGWHYTSVR